MPNNPQVGRQDLAWLYFATVVVLVASVLVYRLASQMLGESGFSEYALVRRTVSFLSPALMLGLGVGLPRFLAREPSETPLGSPRNLFWVSMAPLVIAHVVVTVVVLTNKDAFSSLIFGVHEMSNLVVPILWLIVGLSWHSLLKGYCRGTFRFKMASILDVLNLAVIPVMAFWLFSDSVVTVVMATGLAIVVICAGFTTTIGLPSGLSLVDMRNGVKRFLVYSLPRVPGDFAVGGLLALPSLLAANIVGPKIAGYVAFGATFLALGGAAVAPISTAMLPLASHRIRNRQWHLLRSDMSKVMGVSFAIGLLGVTIAECLMPWIIEIYLGESYAESVPILRILALGAFPYVMFCSLRSFLDAAHETAFNTRNAILALLGFGLTLAIYKIGRASCRERV